MKASALRSLPAVEKVLQSLGEVDVPRPVVVGVVRRELAGLRSEKQVPDFAAVLMLILRHFTSGERKEVVISRGELIQIGGGFRIPEILEASGAKLREVGTTNKTSLGDYAKAIGKGTA